MPTRLIVTYGDTSPADDWTDTRCSNTLYYQPSAGTPDAATLAQEVADVYAARSTEFVIGTVRVKAYDFDGVSPSGPPVATRSASGPAPGSGVREVALCLSYFALVNTPRSRGRLFLGPFANTSSQFPVGALITEALQHGRDLAALGSWSLYSPTVQAFSAISDLWVDNAWDTQRSRGLEPTVRSTFDLAAP